VVAGAYAAQVLSHVAYNLVFGSGSPFNSALAWFDRAPPAGKGFYDPESGYDLELYVSLIEHLRDDPGQLEQYRDRMVTALKAGGGKNGSIGEIVDEIARERVKAGFAFEPARLETLISRQAESRYQAVVELINNGFDAMGDAIGRFGRGSTQALGMLANDGDSLTYRTVPASDRRTMYRVTYRRVEGKIRINFYREALAETHHPGTEVVLRTSAGVDREELERYLQRKLGRCRRGYIFLGEKGTATLNDLSGFAGPDGEAVSYRLGDMGVRYWVDGEGCLHVADSGTGMEPLKKGKTGDISVILEALPVPYVSTNRTSDELRRALLDKNDLSADGAGLFYTPGGSSKRAG
jgi:hypothetical protein